MYSENKGNNENNRIQINSENFEPVAKSLAATTLANVISSSLRRQYLETNNESSSLLKVRDPGNMREPVWIKVDQVGRPINNDLQNCLSSLERILQIAHMPQKQQLLFLVISDGISCKMFIGLRPLSFTKCDEEIEFVKDFGSSNWPGLQFSSNLRNNSGINSCQDLLALKHCGIVAMTGLPTTRKSGFSSYPVTIDRFMGAMHGRKWAYLVVADPMDTFEVDNILYACRDLAGRTEAMKEFNYSECIQSGASEAYSQAKAEFENWSYSHNTSSKDWGSKSALLTAGGALLSAGALLANVILPGSGILATIGASLNSGMVLGGLGLALNAFIPTKSEGHTESGGTSTTKSFTKTYSDSQSKTLSQTFVNKHIEAVSENLNYHISRYKQCQALGSWQVGAYLIAEDDQMALSGGQLLRSLVSGDESHYEPIRMHLISKINRSQVAKNLRLFENPDIKIVDSEDNPIPHFLGEKYQSLLTPLSTKELAILVNFPTRSVPGIDVIDVPAETSQQSKPLDSNSIEIGKQLYSGNISEISYPINRDVLAKHVLVCGINGSGKSITCRKILQELMECKNSDNRNEKSGIPFLVIEPAKDEYVEWAMRVNSEAPGSINIFMPGRNKWKEHKLQDFYLNPFDIVWLDNDSEPRVLEHIDRLKTIINASLPMQEVLPVLMEELVYRIYSISLKCDIDKKDSDKEALPKQYRWLPKDIERDILPLPNMRRPTFSRLREQIKLVIAEKGYDPHISMNLKAALTTRVDSFMRGWRNTVLNQDEPNPGFWRTLFDKPTVVNLSALTSDEDKAFFMAVLIQFLYEYRQAQYELEQKSLLGTPKLRHMLVIEEAHRILCNSTSYSALTANPMAKVGEMFSNMISEIRAYGQGILIADQIPGRLNQDAIKNTNLKIVHRLVSSDDRDMMSVCLDLKSEHGQILGGLKPGYALIRGDMDNIASWVKIHQSKWENT